MDAGNPKLSFWEHLDELRGALVRIGLVALGFAIVAFCFKNLLFSVLLAPQNSSFFTYALFTRIAEWTGSPQSDFSVQLINTGLARQFIVHMKMALCAGFFIASPYILYQLFRFVSPALYANERLYATRVTASGYLMFILGVLLSYFLIFPLTFRFLGTYQVSPAVSNLISLDSYISTLLSMCLMMGIVFEIPVLCWLFAKLGFISASFMRRYRKHAVVIILVLAAIITPTSDIVTLLVVSLPMYLLYEISILLIRRTEKSPMQ